MNLDELYRSAFPDGTKVVIVDEEDRVVWGKLRTTDDHAIVMRGKIEDLVPWETVRFMAQDEFSFHKVTGPMPSEAEMRMNLEVGIRKELNNA